jgi:hypothetical protein
VGCFLVREHWCSWSHWISPFAIPCCHTLAFSVDVLWFRWRVRSMSMV